MNQLNGSQEASLNQLIDIYDTWYKPWWHSKIFYISILFIIIFLILIFIYFSWKKYFGSKKLSFEQIALLQLQKLSKKQYESEESMQDAYFQITMIMKIYLSKQYKIELIDKTDNEILDSLKSNVKPDIFINLQEIFLRAYKIKFAKSSISLKILYDDISSMQNIINKIIEQNNNTGGN